MIQPPRPRADLAVAPLLALSLVLGACDNPTCVFGGDCSGAGGGGGGGLGTEAASFPATGAHVLPAAPELVRVEPRGAGAHPATPIFVEFTESIDPDSLAGSLEVVDLNFLQPVPLLQPVPTAAEGRVAILLPVTDLIAGRQYAVRYSASPNIVDLNGQTLAAPALQRVAEFTVALTPDPVPRVLATFPEDGDQEASDLGSIVVVFDRPMDPDTVTDDSFQVTVDGQDPDPDPEAGPLVVQAGPIEVPVDQVFVWRSVADGLPVSLGADAQVELTLSPGTAPIFPEDEDGEALETFTLDFDVAPIAAPTAVFKDPLAEPADAIGGGNLADPAAPVVAVELGAAPGSSDRLGVFLFGLSTGTDPVLRSLYREVSLADVQGTAVQLGEAELDLLDENGDARLAEGTIEIAVQARRGTAVSGLRRFDADLDTAQPERPVLDVTAPVLLGLGAEGTDLASYTSDVRDLVLVGRADEEIAFALVEGPGGDNSLEAGVPPPVAGATAGGLFVTRPLGTQVLGPGEELSLSITVYDRALNAAEPISGVTYRQVGLVEGGGLVGGEGIAVRVLDARTRAPLQGALVISQGLVGAAFSTVATLTSGPDGRVSIPSASAPATTVLTVHLEGYDLFTFSDVPGPALDVLLEPTGAAPATTSGVVTAPVAAGAVVDGNTNLLGETRVDPPGDPFLAVGDCSFDQGTLAYACPFGAFDVGAARLGAQSLVSAEPTTSLVLAFALRYPILPVAGGVGEEGVLAIDSLLATQGSEASAIVLPPTTVIGPQDATFGDLASFEVTVEAVAAGVRGSLPIGLGAGIETLGVWTASGSYPGAADGVADDQDDELGSLVTRGALQDDLLLRLEFADEDGNRAGVRPRLASDLLDVQPMASTEVPALRAPLPGTTTVGPSYALELVDVLPDAYGTEGLVRVELTGADGRRWVLWTQDPPGGGASTLLLRVPPIQALGGQPLPSGTVTARTAVLAWPGLDLSGGRMLWSDPRREFERFGFGAPVEFQQP